MRAYIFTEGGSKTGFGHITRCLALYDELASRGLDVGFFVYGDEGVLSVLQNRKATIADWYSEDFLESLLDRNALAIVDSYLASEEIFERISHIAGRALYIDDNMRIQYPKGIVANPSLYVDPAAYRQTGEIRYLFGAPYVILRKPFQSGSRSSVNKDANEVLIIMGGTDPYHLTPRIVQTVDEAFPELKKNVVIGKGYHPFGTSDAGSNGNTRYYHNLDGQQMKELMLKCDFAITAAGQTIYELIRTQTPFIPIQIADNQKQNVAGIRKFRLAGNVLHLESDRLTEELKQEIRWMTAYENRNELFYKMNGLIDGMGSSRIIDALLT